MGEATLGRTCRARSLFDVAPRLRADSMYASSRTAMTSPRSRRTNPGTNTMAMAMAASLTSAPSNAATVRARISGGNENSASIVRMITESTAPRKKPAMRPSGMATNAAKPTISKAARNEMRAPQMSRLKYVAPEVVRPEPMRPGGGGVNGVDVLRVGRVRCHQGGEDGRENDEDQKDHAGDGPVLMEESNPETRTPLGQLVGTVAGLGNVGEADEGVVRRWRAPRAHSGDLTTAVSWD
jgi:hypothetical protein